MGKRLLTNESRPGLRYHKFYAGTQGRVTGKARFRPLRSGCFMSRQDHEVRESTRKSNQLRIKNNSNRKHDNLKRNCLDLEWRNFAHTQESFCCHATVKQRVWPVVLRGVDENNDTHMSHV